MMSEEWAHKSHTDDLLKTYSPCHIRTLEISTQRSIDRWLAIPTTIWEHFSPPLSIYGILSLLPHWTSQTLLNSKMSLTVFIDFIQRWAWPFLSTLYIYIVNRFNSISVFNSHSLGMQCMYVFFLLFFYYGMELLFYIRVMVTAFAD